MNREQIWELIAQPWDIIVIGGGITGAGVLYEATRQGFRTVLFEGNDFAWGTSSRSGKLIHGGLRYLRQGKIKLVWDSVRERERLLRELKGLVNPLRFLLPNYRGERVGKWALGFGMIIYDLIAGRRYHRYLDPETLKTFAPHIRAEKLKGGFYYLDALTDDARLVLRLIQDAESMGGVALNYARVEGLCRARTGLVEGVIVRDLVTNKTIEVRARIVINAAGVWADSFRVQLGRNPKLRPLRGSHLLFPGWRIPVALGISFFHPWDGRPLYILPWEGLTLVGTTDVDHREDLEVEPRIQSNEAEYLMSAVKYLFPFLDINENDVLATFSGIRPVIGTGKKEPSKEPRDYAIWDENGLVTVTGGKLTTFGVMARSAIAKARRRLPEPKPVKIKSSIKNHCEEFIHLDEDLQMRLLGRYGEKVLDLIHSTKSEELENIPGTSTLWAEVRWAVEREKVVHLDDLLLRRVRLGLQLPQGASVILERLRIIIQPVLGWDDARWQKEVERYMRIWNSAYSPALIKE